MRRATILATTLLVATLALCWILRHDPGSQPERHAQHVTASIVAETVLLASTEQARAKRTTDPDPAAPAAEERLSACTLVVHCEDESRKPITTATYWLIAHGRVESISPTRTVAGDELPLPLGDGARSLGIRADGFADSVLQVPPCPGPPLTARLIQECPLEGRVVRFDGIVPEPVTLVAWPVDAAFEPRRFDFQHPGLACDGALVCTSSPEGRFSFRGARSERAYAIYGGGSGMILRERVTRVAAPRQDLELVVVPAFAALVSVMSDAGAPVSVRVGSGVGLEFSIQDQRLGPMASRPFEAVLAGLSQTLLDPAAHEFLAIVSGPVSVPTAGPCRLAIAAPGFAAEMLDFSAHRLHMPLARVEMRLRPTASSFGTLTVRLLGGAQRRSDDRWPSGLIRLVDAQGNALTFRHPGESADFTTVAIPASIYTVAFEAAVGAFRHPQPGAPDVTVEVGARPALVEIPLGDSGMIALQVVTAEDGQEYRGPLNVMVSQAENATDGAGEGFVVGLFPLAFEGPPYQIPVAGPGTYKLKILSPRRDPKLHSKPSEIVVVEPGSRTEHWISVRP